MSFVKNDNQQLTLLDSTFNLTEREKRMLEKSWAKTFADKVFPAIDENIFSVLYSKKASRPNTPVNVIVGALILKEALNVTDMKSLKLWRLTFVISMLCIQPVLKNSQSATEHSVDLEQGFCLTKQNMMLILFMNAS